MNVHFVEFNDVHFNVFKSYRKWYLTWKKRNFPQFRKSYCRKSLSALNKLRLFFRGKYFSFFFSQFDIIFHVVVILDTKDIVSKNQTVFFPQNSKHSSVKDFWGRQKKSNCNSPWSLAIIIYICRYPVIGFGMLWCSYFWESIFCRVLSSLNRTTNWKAVDFSNCTHTPISKIKNVYNRFKMWRKLRSRNKFVGNKKILYKTLFLAFDVTYFCIFFITLLFHFEITVFSIRYIILYSDIRSYFEIGLVASICWMSRHIRRVFSRI